MTGRPSWDVLPALVAERWEEYARPRFGSGTRSEHGGRTAGRKGGEAAWSSFLARSVGVYAALARTSRCVGGRLDFKLEHLQLFLLLGLSGGCELCGARYGVARADVVWIEHPNRFYGADGIKGQRVGRNRLDAQQMCRLKNLLPACAGCAQAIDLLSVKVWRDVLMALKAEPEWIATRYLARASGRGSFRPAPPASNALAATLAQAPRGKKGLSTR